METYDLVINIFRIAGLVLLFVLALGVFLNIAGYVLIGGEVQKQGDVSLCKTAAAMCVNMLATGGADCYTICLNCPDSLYEKCLKGDASLFR